MIDSFHLSAFSTSANLFLLDENIVIKYPFFYNIGRAAEASSGRVG
jgi:hypothetical protein